MYVFLSVCMYTGSAVAHGSQRKELDSSGNGLDGCKLMCGCWEVNLGPLKEQPVLLMIDATL